MALSGALLLSASCIAAVPSASKAKHVADGGFDIKLGRDVVHVGMTTARALHVEFRADGKPATPSFMVDPTLHPESTDSTVHEDASTIHLDSPQLHATWNKHKHELSVEDAAHHVLLRETNLAELGQGHMSLGHAADQPMYGIGGYNATEDASAGLLRDGHQKATAGEQGHAGSPFVWTTAGYGVLVDSVGADFELGASSIDAHVPKGALGYYVVVGKPSELFGAVATISGPSQLFPKWAMGFTNSQWGIDEKELIDIVMTYRKKHIPIDNFTLDFDWKAWGQDHYGEFRWNQEKFPQGPTGRLKQLLQQLDMQLTGIMKPRIHVDTEQGRYATAHGFWSPASKAAPDYFSTKPVRELDFDQPAVRAWFYNDKLKRSFATGMHGWWNDEADDVGSDTQFTNMQRALYDGQRASSPLRVWSINRNFYLGAQRYAYAMWSGDIATGFDSMAGQRARMLSAIDVGAMQWGMDGGGFNHGTPTPENYARWIEFGAFTPIFRVHGELGQKRQPWVYGPIAEKAATDAMRLRYSFIPYIYSYEQTRHTTGVGLVRPLMFDWPNDASVRNDVDAWMFGDSLLVSPVVAQGQTSKDIYLPAGRWIDWFSGKVHSGEQTIHYGVDSKSWGDIPLFVRDGAIIPMQPPMDYVGQHPLVEMPVEIFPSAARTSFDYYDDNGSDYSYEHGNYFSQTLAAQRSGDSVTVETGDVRGSFAPALKFYLLKIHGGAASKIIDGGTLTSFTSLDALQKGNSEGWASGKDRFGAVTWVRVAAAKAQHLALTFGH
nr:TIM-barrel domain-containing protein [Rhodanobacter sp. L36]